MNSRIKRYSAADVPEAGRPGLWVHAGDFNQALDLAAKREATLRQRLTIADQQTSELSWIAKSAYEEGLKSGWIERHTDTSNAKRVTPWAPPNNLIEQEWLKSEARASLHQSALAGPAGDAPEEVTERSPKDYAIEHAGYLANAVDEVLADYQAYTLAQMLADEGGDEGEAELTDAVDQAIDDLHEALSNLRGMAYAFRKRRDRALR